jgi:AcrR family transcriptional regulator
LGRLPATARREQLLDTAAELFARLGYARATTAELAKAAGVTEPIIYRHFESKKALFVALITRTGAATLEAWDEHLAGAKDPGERLRRLIGDNPMVAEQGRSAYRVFLQATTETDDPDIRAAVDQHIRSLFEFVLREVKVAQEAHRVTARYPAELIAWLLIDIGLGYGVLSAMGIQGHGQDAQGGHVQHVLARILTGPEPKG